MTGLSGGGPYALACAHEMPERVAGAAILGGLAPAAGPDATDDATSALIRLTAPLLGCGAAPGARDPVTSRT